MADKGFTMQDAQMPSPVILQRQPTLNPGPLILDSSLLTTAIEPPVKKNRCGCCKKKLMLSDFDCRGCKARYCGLHRLPEAHACAHDFRKEGQAILAKQNGGCVNDKLEKI